eukprot:GFUD01000235.1.p1 GENE.GFUD01000235.1~~GFUD01000235.1.p1  ORF type:complete len:472 (-),score=104.34 GFUD01000235.1:169-1584(-)
MVCRKYSTLGLSSLNTFLGSRFILFFLFMMICIICTSYEYIINVTVGNTKYATFVGVGMIAQLKEEKSEVETILTDLPLPSVISNVETRLESDLAGNKSDTKPTMESLAAVSVEINNEDQTAIKQMSSEAPIPATKHITENSQDGEIRQSDFQINSNKSIKTLEVMDNFTLEKCNEIPSQLRGKLQIVKEVQSFSSIMKENPSVLPGGEDSPEDCSTRHNVAIIVPYRDRRSQLAVFLRHIHPVLKRQDLHYRIYIVNQADNNTFNRAMLMNVGFTEAMQDFSWDCCIFHDVDLLPEDDRNLYTCPEQPRHMSVAVDKFKYKLPYKTIFGGVAAIRVDQFRKLNGFSNQFWGWGGEDDDMSKRIHYHKLRITRYKPEVARYTMLKHKQEKVNKERARVLRTSHRRYKTDGLNSLKYQVLAKELMPLYTNVSVALHNPGKPNEILKMKRNRYEELKHTQNMKSVHHHHPHHS